MSTLLRSHYKFNISQALQTLYPEYDWQPWTVGRNHWLQVEHQRRLFNKIAEEKGVERIEDWIEKVPSQEILLFEGVASVLKNYYDSNRYRVLEVLYPEYPSAERVEGELVTYHRKEMDKYSIDNGIVSPEEWYLVRTRDIAAVFFSNYYQHNMSELLQTVYPEYHWNAEQIRMKGQMKIDYSAHRAYRLSLLKNDSNKNNDNKDRVIPPSNSKSERRLYLAVEKLFPQREIEVNYKHPWLIWSQRKSFMQLDIYIPSLQLAIEYQGEQHYSHTRTLYQGELPQQKVPSRSNIYSCI